MAININDSDYVTKIVIAPQHHRTIIRTIDSENRHFIFNDLVDSDTFDLYHQGSRFIGDSDTSHTIYHRVAQKHDHYIDDFSTAQPLHTIIRVNTRKLKKDRRHIIFKKMIDSDGTFNSHLVSDSEWETNRHDSEITVDDRFVTVDKKVAKLEDSISDIQRNLDRIINILDRK